MRTSRRGFNMRMRMRAPESVSPAEMATELLHSATNMHLMHFMTRSYPQHIALQEYYDKIVGLTDRLVESVQGYNGEILTGYTPSSNRFETSENPRDNLTSLRRRVEIHREIFGDDSSIQAIIDDILELMDTTIYKLFAFTN